MTILEKAITYALKAHTGEKRKNSTLPYILHPLEALVTAASLTDDMEVLAAVVLHDTVEDTGISLADIEREFGHYVAWLVDCETEDTIEYETEEISEEDIINYLIESGARPEQLAYAGDQQ